MSTRTASLLGAVVALVALVALVAANASPGRAADASPWDGRSRAAVRVIAAAADAPAKVVRAGIEIRLDPGWKTYWRYPGDSGVPPRFGFTRSENVASVSVLWPAPQSFSDGSGRSIGYKDDVIFPLRIVPRDPAKPVVLRLDLDYAICEKLCVPAEAKAELVLAGDPSTHDAALARSEARVPRPTDIGEAGPLAIKAVTREAGAARQRILVDVVAPDGQEIELFAEGPTPDWALPVPEVLAGAPPGLRRFAFELDGLPPGATADGAVLRLTAVAGASAIEVAARLD